MPDDVLDLLDSIDKGDAGAAGAKDKPKKARSKGKARDANSDLLGFLDEITKENESRQGTPRRSATPVAAEAREAETPTPAAAAPAPAKASRAAATAPAPESKAAGSPRTSSEAAAAAAVGATAAGGDERDPAVMPDPIASISSWWSRNKGGIWDSASTAAKEAAERAQGAYKQAEARVKELQQAELESRQGSGLVDSLQTRFTSVLRTIAPPISRHEQLTIHIFHDMVGYPRIDGVIHSVFERIMDQVEGGGDLNMIVQKGRERHKAGSDHEQQRQLNALRGTVANGEKLAKANIEEFQRKQEAKPAVEAQHISEVFLSIQPVITPAEDEPGAKARIVDAGTLAFVVYLTDPANDVHATTVSQPFPDEWADWLDAPESTYKEAAVDPRVWALDWIEDGLGLAVGVVAQKYVTTRMGISVKK